MEGGGVTDDFCCSDIVYVIRKAGCKRYWFYIRHAGVYFLNSGDMYVTKFTAGAETVHPMAPEFLYYATIITPGIVK